MGKLKNFGKSYLKVSTFGLVDIDKKSKKRASEKSDTPAQKEIEEAPKGIFDKVKILADNIEKKVENLDDTIKNFDDKLSKAEAINLKFDLKNEYVKQGTISTPSTIFLPSGVHEIIINVMGKPVKKLHKCYFTNKRTNCVLIQVGMGGCLVCGDILIILKEMGYDLASKDDWKRAKEEKEKIMAKYDEFVSEKPELFDASKVDLNTQDEPEEEAPAKGDESSPVTIDYDKFNNKKTIHSAYTIRYTIAKNSCEKIFRKVAAIGISLDAYIDLTPRLVDTKDLCIIVIDVHYGGDDWIFLDSGKMVVIADDSNFQFQPKGDKTDVKSGMAGNISEDVYYPLSIQDFETLANAEKIELQISGKSSHVEFETNLNTDVFGGFYNAVFDGDEPIMDKNDVTGVKEAAPAETPSQESQTDEEVDVEKELEKLKGLLDKGLITQEAYDAKMNKLLGL